MKLRRGGVILAGALLITCLALVEGVRAENQEELDPGYWQRSTLPQMGLATYYAPGLMDYVHDYRVQRGQLPECPDCVGSVALLRAGDIGRKVWLQPPGGELAGPFLVVDCARPEDVPPLVDRNWAVDVSYELGQTWGISAPLDGVIVWPDPSEGNAPAPTAQATLFYIDPRDVVISVPTAVGTATPSPALATRLPVPRSTPIAPIQLSAVAPAPPRVPTSLTPVITTPTPPGGVRATEMPAVIIPAQPAPQLQTAAAIARHITVVPPVRAAARLTSSAGTPVASQVQVSFGRAGQGLLSGHLPATVQVIAAIPVATLRPLRPPTLVAPGMPAHPRFPAATRTPVPKSQPKNGSILEQVWQMVVDWLVPSHR